MRFLLINPPNIQFGNDVDKAVLPLGLCYLAAVLLKNNHEVKIIDMVIENITNRFDFHKHTYYGMDLDGIRKEISTYQPDTVGVSCLFAASCDMAMELCKISKECNVHYTLVGGPMPSASPNLFIEKTFIDFVFLGESEKTIEDFAAIADSTQTPDFTNVDGIVYRNSSGKIICQPKTSFIEDLDSIPFPARHLLPVEKYFEVSSPQGGFYKSKRNTPIVTSRGCPAKCFFCASTNIWGNRYRYRSAENIIAELKQLKQDYRIEEFQVQDDNFTMNKKRTLLVCQMLKDLHLNWSIPNGVALWALDEERIRAMSEAGCHYVIAAIESGNQRVLKEVIRKPLNLKKGIEICKIIKRYKIKLAGFFIIGFPDEKIDEVKDTFDYALKCDLDLASFSYATPLPSTDLWKQAEKENLFVDGFDLANVTYERPSLKSKNWTLEELQDNVNALSRKFYFKTFIRHPGVILFRILDTLRRDPVKLIRIFASRFFGI